MIEGVVPNETRGIRQIFGVDNRGKLKNVF